MFKKFKSMDKLTKALINMVFVLFLIITYFGVLGYFANNPHVNAMLVEEEHFPAPAEFIPPVESNTNLPPVYDDGAGSAYVRFAGDSLDHNLDPDKVIASLMEGKKWWKENHPEKRIVSITAIHGAWSHYTCVVGLLMAYEDR